MDAAVRAPGLHDPIEPEYSILKQRLARRIRYEKLDPQLMDLPSLTALAERTISDDLEYLIEKAVNPATSDYAVITGVEIHNWAAHLEEGGDPSMEFIAPTKAYVVVNGVKTHLDLMMVPVSGLLEGGTAGGLDCVGCTGGLGGLGAALIGAVLLLGGRATGLRFGASTGRKGGVAGPDKVRRYGKDSTAGALHTCWTQACR